MKTTRIALAMLAGALWTAGPAASADLGFDGRWRGLIVLAAGGVEVEIDLAENDGTWTGSLSAPALELVADELTELEVDDHGITFTAPGLGNGVRFRAALASAGETLRGESAERPPAVPPATDIYLFEAGGFEGWTSSPPRNVTDRDGYDNQPHFLPDGSGLLYTSIRDGQADIYRYSLADGATTRVTDTPESEYSPTLMPGGERFSTVRVEADGAQRLWSFALAGGDPRLVLPDLEPVGYHVWVGGGRVALFVLGDPPTLQVADPQTGRSRQLAASIGRSLHRVPGLEGLSFVEKRSADDWRIVVFDPWLDQAVPVAGTRAGSEDLTWTDGRQILMGEGSKLYARDLEAEVGETGWTRESDLAEDGVAVLSGPMLEPDATGWLEIADLEPFGVRGITRLALSPDQRHLAVVGTREVAPPPTPDPRPFELRRP